VRVPDLLLQHSMNYKLDKTYIIKKRKEKPVLDYIERWGNLVLSCKEKINEASSIDICI
jgi:hypothetical protein